MRNVLIPCVFCGRDLADVPTDEFESVAGEIACNDCAATLTTLAIAIAKGEQRYTEFPRYTAGEHPTMQMMVLPEAQRCQPVAMVFPVFINKSFAGDTPAPHRTLLQRVADYWRRWYAWYMEEK